MLGICPDLGTTWQLATRLGEDPFGGQVNTPPAPAHIPPGDRSSSQARMPRLGRGVGVCGHSCLLGLKFGHKSRATRIGIAVRTPMARAP